MKGSLLILMLMAATAYSVGPPNLVWSTSIKELCGMAPYPNTCYHSLGSAPIVNSITELYSSQFLYKIYVEVSIDEVSKMLNDFVYESGTLTDSASLISISASETCYQLLSLALDNLNSSLPTTDFDVVILSHETRGDFKTWLSAAYTDLQTCMDGFDDAPNNVRSRVMEKVNSSTISVSISLAIMCKIDDHYIAQSGSSKTLSTSENWPNVDLKQMEQQADAIVANNGSGNYSTINAALNVVPDKSLNRFVIYVKSGVYNEIVHVGKNKWNVMMFGEGMNNTIVSGNLTTASGIRTFQTATFAVFGKGFIARDMGFVNTVTGKHQAVALLSTSDKSAFYRCRIESHQDTLYLHSNRQFYRECNIYGTVDFIFGDASVVIQNSFILPKRPINGNTNIITAQGKSNPCSNTGISIQNCVISPGEDLEGVQTFLGRPWRNYSTIMIMQTKLDSLIDPRGWLAWNSRSVPGTIHYVEYCNRGAGASIAKRVKWKGVSAENSTREEASMFIVRALINGDQWLPATGVPFQLDLWLISRWS